MDYYTSTANMLFQMETKQKWTKQQTDYGYILKASPQIADGQITIWGDANTYCYINSDVVFHVPLIERYHFKQKSIQISFVDNMTLNYYQKKNEMNEASSGLFCFVNNIHRPWFKRFPSNTKQKVCSISITDDFFISHNITLPHDGWDRLAIALNGKIFIPKLAILFEDIKNIKVNRNAFDIVFRGKIMEIIGLLLDYALTKEKEKTFSISNKSRNIAKKAIYILNQNYIHPPVIGNLAQTLGIDANTLQKAFKQIVGQSVYEYIVSLKMEKALALLEDTSLTIEDISKLVGYQSKISFYKAFKKTYDCKPNELRKQILFNHF